MSDELAADAVVDEKPVVDPVVDKPNDPPADKAPSPAKDEPADKAAPAADDKGDKAAVDKAAEGGEDKPGELPENWRELGAGDDKELLAEIKRYGSLKGVFRALKEAKDTIRSGKMKQAMPDPADEKGMAEWRKAEGIPDDPSGYKLPETVTKRMTDDDKPLIASFTDYAHKKGARPDVVEIASEWYFDSLEAIEAERIAADTKASEDAEESLRSTWGNAEFKGNLKLAQRFVETIPGVGKDWSEARLPNGARLGDIPEFMEWASDQGRATFGDVTFATSDSAARHASRKEEIEKTMKSDMKAYWADPAMQKEYADILAKEEKRKA